MDQVVLRTPQGKAPLEVPTCVVGQHVAIRSTVGQDVRGIRTGVHVQGGTEGAHRYDRSAVVDRHVPPHVQEALQQEGPFEGPELVPLKQESIFRE